VSPPAPPPLFSKTVISGSPRERGRQYGGQFAEGIRAFLDKEIYQPFAANSSAREELLRYAGACGKAVQEFSPIVHDELEGMAEGSGLRLEELVLITLHEELYHQGVVPKVPHCTAAAAGPPDTTGATYVGQTWDWMPSVFGLSSLVQWERPEGPSLLAYAFPGLWVGAGLNSAGLALCWTSAGLGDHTIAGPRVGIPSYILIAHLMYQESIEAVMEEARRAKHAGWFTFVMADGEGNLLNVEGSPTEVAVERHRGRLARIGYGSRQMTKTAPGGDVPYVARCQKMYDLLAESAGSIEHTAFQRWFQEPTCEIAVASTIDIMVYNTTAREAYLSRGPGYGANWQKFAFDNSRLTARQEK
jgi:isopenicillin-N N-acyltransferase-like protein